MVKLTTLIKLFNDNFREEFSQLNCHKNASAINAGFVAEQDLKRLNLRKKSLDLTLLTITKETKGFHVAIVRKLLEKCPVNYKLVRNTE